MYALSGEVRRDYGSSANGMVGCHTIQARHLAAFACMYSNIMGLWIVQVELR